MRLFEAILDVNRRRVAGDRNAVINPTEFASALPLAALTCIDARLNHLVPEMLGVPEDQFIWLRNAGNIITGPLSSTMRSLALACAVKGAHEIAIIGHTDCLVGKTTMLQLLDRLGALGVDRHQLPENLVEYFGLFGSERQNVIRGVDFVRASPLIGRNVPVHGLVLDLTSGALEWVVNGYAPAPAAEPVVAGKLGEWMSRADQALESATRIGNAAADEFKFPTGKIGDVVTTAHEWLHRAEKVAAEIAPQTAGQPVGAAPALPTPSPAGAPPALSNSPQAPVPTPLTTLQQRMRQFTARSSRPQNPRKR